MAYESNAYALKITLVAGADLSSAQYKFVKLDSNGAAVVCSAVTDVPVGVLQNMIPEAQCLLFQIFDLAFGDVQILFIAGMLIQGDQAVPH